MRPIIISVLLLLVFGNVCAQELSGIPASFIDVGVGARPAALAHAFTSMADDASAVFWNAAGLTTFEGKSVLLSRANHFGLIPYSALAFGMPISSLHAAGIGVTFSGDDQLNESTFLASYGLKLNELWSFLPFETSAGVSLKWQSARFGRQDIDAGAFPLFTEDEIQQGREQQVRGSSSGLGMDFGMLLIPSARLRTAIAWRNVFSSVSWDNGDESYREGVPGAMILAMSYLMPGHFNVSTDFEASTSGETSQLRVGGERALWDKLFLRGGIAQSVSAESNRNYALGAGIQHRFGSDLAIGIDYAYQMHDLADTQKFSMRIGF